MNFKLLCLDLDGTILPKNHKISEFTKAAIKLVQDMGLHIVISTGRSLAEAKYFANQLGVQASIISSNGAYAIDYQSNETFHREVLGQDVIKEIFRVCGKYGINPCFQTPDQLIFGDDYLEFIRKKQKKIPNMSKEMFLTTKIHVISEKEWQEIINREKDKILKCIIYNENINVIRSIKVELRSSNKLEVVGSASETHIEVNNKGTSKGRTVALFANILKIKREEIIAIGDSENDMDMIKFAGLGIAMGNANNEVKEIADYVTATNEEDGVARALEKFVLKQAVS